MKCRTIEITTLRELFRFDAENGSLIRIRSPQSSRIIEIVAGTRRSDGYRLVGVQGVVFHEHRVIWALLQAGGALWLASNVRTSPRAYIPMMMGAVIWTGFAAYQSDEALFSMQLVFCAINIVGIVRWLR